MSIVFGFKIYVDGKLKRKQDSHSIVGCYKSAQYERQHYQGQTKVRYFVKTVKN
jgi:hypothetical protein